MLNTRVKAIIMKIASGKAVTINERLFLENYSREDSETFQKLKKAQCLRRLQEYDKEEITKLLGSLALEGTFEEEHFNPKRETLGDWFTNAPNWLRRS